MKWKIWIPTKSKIYPAQDLNAKKNLLVDHSEFCGV